MSIFSGFATRKQQEKYNNYIVNLITLLQDKILELMAFCRPKQQQSFQSFRYELRDSVRKLAGHMREMERSKYLPPKISPLVGLFLERVELEVDGGAAERCYSQEKEVSVRTNESAVKSNNVRITTKSSGNTVYLSSAHHPPQPTAPKPGFTHKKLRKLYDTLKQNSVREFQQSNTQPTVTLDLESMDMQELLKTRPALPRRGASISCARRKRFGGTNLYEINEFEEEDFNIGPLPERQSICSYQVMSTPHSEEQMHSSEASVKNRQQH